MVPVPQLHGFQYGMVRYGLIQGVVEGGVGDIVPDEMLVNWTSGWHEK